MSRKRFAPDFRLLDSCYDSLLIKPLKTFHLQIISVIFSASLITPASGKIFAILYLNDLLAELNLGRKFRKPLFYTLV